MTIPEFGVSMSMTSERSSLAKVARKIESFGERHRDPTMEQQGEPFFAGMGGKAHAESCGYGQPMNPILN
jgi:hypothetical protein